jgi:hypothetical protein
MDPLSAGNGGTPRDLSKGKGEFEGFCEKFIRLH